MFNRILVVCTGNICRSPIGEALLRQKLAGNSAYVGSAGIGALVGHAADPMARTVALAHGLDLNEHRAQQATLPLLASMDLILTMDQTHDDWINRTYPQMRGRVFKILKWQGNRDVADPYRLPREAFETAYDDIAIGVDEWIKRI